MTTQTSATASPSSQAHARSPRDIAIRYGFLVLLFGLVVFFSVMTNGFSSPQSAVFILQSVSITGILALGVTATLVVGGFDLSIGSVATTAMMASSYVMVVMGGDALTATLVCLAIGAAVGLINGVIIVYMRVPDLLATLGMMFLLLGAQRIPTEGRSIATGIGTYVAIESFAGSLNGLEGSFNFIHCASTRGRDRSNEFFLIVDGSGTGRLHGISGSGGIRIDEAGTHHLWFDYNLP